MSNSWNQRVWDLVACVPEGRVVTYGQVASMLGHPRRARQVGYALHQTPDHIHIPWHRVINGRGQISFPPASRRYLLQQAMLARENVVMIGDRIDLKVYGWRP